MDLLLQGNLSGGIIIRNVLHNNIPDLDGKSELKNFHSIMKDFCRYLNKTLNVPVDAKDFGFVFV